MFEFEDLPTLAKHKDPVINTRHPFADVALPGTMLAAMHTLQAQCDFDRAQVVYNLLQAGA
ncbi:MAG: hypothetical protein AB9Q19_01480 [Candidatus Reddybacter sp.]